MKVKLKKHKNSPAPHATEQVELKRTIENLRKMRTCGVPIHVIYDRGCQQIADLASRIQKNKEKTPAPVETEQAENKSDSIVVAFVINGATIYEAKFTQQTLF